MKVTKKPYRWSFFLIRLLTGIIPSKTYKKFCRDYAIQKLNLEYKRQLAIKKYLKKYVASPKLGPISNNINGSNLPIWQLWLQDWDNAPDVVQFCAKQVDKYSFNRKIIRLSESNIYEYISLPKYIIDKRNKGIIPNAHFSDIIRICLLETYGGTWIDATVLLTKEIPEEILSSNFFVFTVPENSPYRPFHISSNWFIHTNPQHIFITQLKHALFENWKTENTLLDYIIFHLFLCIIIESHIELKNEWIKMVKITNEEPHALQYHLKYGFEKNVAKELLIKSPVHKLTYRLKGFNEFTTAINFYEEIKYE